VVKKISQDAFEKSTNALASIFLVLGVLLYAVGNLGNRFFFSGEATFLFQFLGVGPEGQETSYLANAWSANQSHLEPGLYTWIEHFWAQNLGTGILTLRVLPFLLFLTYVAALLLLSRLVKAPWFLGCAVVGLMFLDNFTPFYAVELSTVTAALAAAVLLPFVAIWLTVARSFLLAVVIFVGVFTIFASFQYNTLPIILGLAVVLIVASVREKVRSRRTLLRIFAALSVLWLPLLYLAFAGNPLKLVGGAVLTNNPEVSQSILLNFFSATSLPRTIFLILIPILWLLKKYPPPTRESSGSEWVINALWIAVFVSTGASFLLAAAGVNPWILGARGSIADVGLIALSLVGLVGLLARSTFMSGRHTRILVLLLSLVVCFAGVFRLATYERNPGFNWAPTLETMFAGRSGGTLVDPWIYPELRYWIEYSGQYDQFRGDWISHDIRVASPIDKAYPKDIQAFFDSDADRLLLRKQTVLEGIEIPSDIRVEPVNFWGDDANYPPLYPVLLSRN